MLSSDLVHGPAASALTSFCALPAGVSPTSSPSPSATVAVPGALPADLCSRAERRMGWKGRGGLGAEGSLSASCPVPLPGKPSLSTDGPCLVPSTVTGTDSPESPELAAGKSACSHEKPPSTSGSPVLMLEESTAAADAGIWRGWAWLLSLPTCGCKETAAPGTVPASMPAAAEEEACK